MALSDRSAARLQPFRSFSMTDEERRKQIARLLVEHEQEGGDLAALLAGSVGDAMDQLRQQQEESRHG